LDPENLLDRWGRYAALLAFGEGMIEQFKDQAECG
jgi:hypothetical protein